MNRRSFLKAALAALLGPMSHKRQYAKERERARAYAAGLSLSGRDIGPLPPVQDPRRKARGIRSLRRFCEDYLPETFYLPWSPDHLEVLDRLEEIIRRGGLYALAMPRGDGKTSRLLAAALWAILGGYRDYVPIICAGDDLAEKRLESIRHTLEQNERLAADFPEVCYPIRRLEGITNRAAGQLYLGQPTGITWKGDTIVLPTIPGSVATGAVLTAVGITSGKIRGMQYTRPDGRVIRPDFVLIDDPQTDATAKSPTQTRERLRILGGAILNLPAPGHSLAGVCLTTVIRKDDLADQLLDRKRNPDWHGSRYKMMYSWPTAEKRWEEYAALRHESLTAGGDGAEATAYYRRHRKEMDAGGKPGWQYRYQRRTELSAIQHAYNLRLRDPHAFACEMQNEPLDDDALAEILSAGEIAVKLNNHDRGIVPVEVVKITSHWDLHETLLFWAVVGWEGDFSGHVLDYGSHPKQARGYYTLRDAKRTLSYAYPSAAGLQGRLYAGLADLARQILDRPWAREDGSELRVSLAMIDANWAESTDTVYRFCRQDPRAAQLMPSHGRYIGPAENPIGIDGPRSRGKRQPGEIRGLNWYSRIHPSRRVRFAVYDTNWWKSLLHQRLAVPMGGSGSLDLFGKPRTDHQMLAEHLTAEYPIRTEGRGRRVDVWKQRPGRDNHLLDNLVGCAVAANYLGVTLADGPIKARAKSTRRKKVKVKF